MDDGLSPGHFSTTEDPDYRWELYMDWKNVQIESKFLTIEKFCSNKGIKQSTLEEIVREFDSLNPGNRWGVSNGIL